MKITWLVFIASDNINAGNLCGQRGNRFYFSVLEAHQDLVGITTINDCFANGCERILEELWKCVLALGPSQHFCNDLIKTVAFL